MKKILLTILLLSSYSFADEEYKISEWNIIKEKNKLFDNVNYHALLYPKNGTGTFILRCKDNITSAFIAFDDYYFSDDYSLVYIRMDGGKALPAVWKMGIKYNSLFSSKPIKFIRRLSDKKKLLIGYTSKHMTNEVTEFDLEGIDKVSAEVSQHCNWKI
ncbi:TPA: hypothetical protein ACRRXU_002146 [Morganella morganii]|uniref:hypothetical protein n=1 Tax=Morganella morganii TaxID=582 RepID=UPI0029CD6700|nr:hypothetical protein [Morganella morganii]